MMKKDKKSSDTVRSRKSGMSTGTQRFVPVAEIRNNTMLLKNGGMRAVLEVEALNFNLKSETEQQGIIAGYGSFVNTLTFPLQIVVRSTRTNIDEYLAQLRTIGEKHTNEQLKKQTAGYVAFMQKLIEVADIMQKRFYVVVPVDSSMTTKKTFMSQFFGWLHPDDSSGHASQRSKEFTTGSRQLAERVELVTSGLSNIGLHAKRLQTRDLIGLLYQIYNPKTAQNQKLPTDIGQLQMEETTL